MKIKITESQYHSIKEEMGGAGGVHPTYGELNLSQLSPDEITSIGNTEEDSWFDYDYVLNKLRELGWGDISPQYFEEFEGYFIERWGEEKLSSLIDDENLYTTYLDHYLRKGSHDNIGTL